MAWRKRNVCLHYYCKLSSTEGTVLQAGRSRVQFPMVSFSLT